MKVFGYLALLMGETVFSVSAQVMEGVSSSVGWGGLGIVLLTAIPGASKLANELFDQINFEVP